MKKLYVFVAAVCCITATGTAQVEWNIAYNLAAPQQKMAGNIGPVHSVQTGGMFAIPATRGHLAVGVEGGIGNYASISREQTFRFTDGSTTRTMVNYTSNVWNAGLVSRLTLLRKGRVLPFITLRGGYHKFYSNVYVEDPHDPDGCRALERKSILKDGSFTVSYGGGLRTDMSGIIHCIPQGRNWLELSVNQVRGGNIDYINTRQLKDGAPAVNDPDAIKRSLNMRFINASTQNIHEHQVAEVYTTPLRLLDIRLTYTVLLGS